MDYVFPRTVLYQVSLDGLPPGALLPRSQRLEGIGWAVETRIRWDGPRVEAISEIRLSRTRFDPENFPELRKLWNAISMLDGGLVQFAP